MARNCRERIIYRSSAHELGYYYYCYDLRWSAPPEVYSGRAPEPCRRSPMV